MRELKFRIWSKLTKEMSPCIPLEEFCYQEFDRKLRALNKNAVVFMQLTGIHEKKGRELYEGDIVDQIVEGKKIRGTIIWSDNRTQFGMEANLDFVPKEGDLGSNTIELKVPRNSMPELVGNIYENPELLK